MKELNFFCRQLTRKNVYLGYGTQAQNKKLHFLSLLPSFIHVLLHSLLSLTFPLFYTTLPYRLTYNSLPSPRSILHYPSFSLSYTANPSFSLSYTTLTSLCSTLLFLFSILQATVPFLLLSFLHYPGRKDIQ